MYFANGTCESGCSARKPFNSLTLGAIGCSMIQATYSTFIAPSLTVGSRASIGYSGTWLSLSLTRSRASARLVPTGNLSVTDAAESWLLLFISNIPSTLFSRSSCSSVISRSTSSALAPGQMVSTTISGSAVSGVSCTGVPNSAMMPNITDISTPTATLTGLWQKNSISGMSSDPSWPKGQAAGPPIVAVRARADKRTGGDSREVGGVRS
jgi:hypothetical protein